MRIVAMCFLMIVGSCLHGCTATLKSPVEAFGVGSQKDRTVTVSKNIFGAKASIPLTDLEGHGWVVTYDKEAGSFTMKLDDFKQSWSSTIGLENERLKNGAEMYAALTAAQQEVFDRQIDAQKEVGVHIIDAAAQAIGLLAKMPGGAAPASGLIGSLMQSVGPQLMPTLLSALTKNGVMVTPP